MLPEPLDINSKLPWEDDTVIEVAPDTFPALSIVIPIYNAGRFLERTLRSLFLNDLNQIEIIVMDGGSTDGTDLILEHYIKYFDICISERDRGQSDAINKGFEHASGPILYWLNGDDLILPNTLRAARKAFMEEESADVVVGNAYMTELDLTPIRHLKLTSEMLRFDYLIDYASNHLIQPSVFFSRRAWDACGPLQNDLHYAMDADLFLEMSSRYEFIHLPIDIAYSVYHEDCKTRNKRAESILELGLVQAKHGGFLEARRTLNLLADMYNKATKQLAHSHTQGQSECGRCALAARKLKAIEVEVERNKRILLAGDRRKS